jgi:hypothetical protein
MLALAQDLLDLINPLLMKLAKTVMCWLINAQYVLAPTNKKANHFWYNGTDWIEAQAKTSIQQPPLFNVYDSTGVSFSDQIKYPKLILWAVNCLVTPRRHWYIRYSSKISAVVSQH